MLKLAAVPASLAAAATLGAFYQRPKAEQQRPGGKKSVVVIGAGIMGLGTAFKLAERGHKVTLVDKADQTATVCLSCPLAALI